MIALVLASLLTSATPTDGPGAYGPVRGIDYAAAQGAANGRETILLSASSAQPISAAGSGGRPDWFRWGELVVLRAAGNMSCVWTMTTTISLGAWGSGNACTVTDANGPDGPGACVQLGAGERVDQVPKFDVLTKRPGARVLGICTAPVTGFAGKAVYPSCRVDGDCTDAGSAGTCDTDLNADDVLRMQREGGAAVVCRPQSANTALHSRVEQ